MFDALTTFSRSGIVLAAGEGRRLRPFVYRLRRDRLPKQYVNFVGTRSMLEHTFSRAERVIAPKRLFAIVSQTHLFLPEVRRQLSCRPSGTVVVQPKNRETGPGLLLPLMHLYKRYPNSIVAIFPSDHFIVEEELFMAHVDLAFRVVERHPSYLLLLGIEPTEPDTEYGYLLPGPQVSHLAPLAVRGVSRFVEKPDAHSARELIREGGLWNTLVMIFKAKTLLDLIQKVAPELWSHFERVLDAIGTTAEAAVVREAYRNMEAVNFSTGLLEPLALSHGEQLLVLPVRGVFWSDWGSEQRIADFLNNSGREGRRLSRLLEQKRCSAGSG